MINESIAKELLVAATKARENAYAPYSSFRVGAALLGANGKIYVGCNVENASFGATNCAERTALFSAVSDGVRRFEALAIVGGKEDALDSEVTPCGVCRQVLSEFCDADFEIILKTESGFRVIRFGELYPLAFSSENLS